MTSPIVFNNLDYHLSQVAVGDFTGGIFTVRALVPGHFKIDGTISNPGDMISTKANAYLDPFDINLAATQYDNAGSILFNHTTNRSSIYSFYNNLVISNTPLTVGQTITYNETNLGDFDPKVIDDPGTLFPQNVPGYSLSEGRTLTVDIYDYNLFSTAPVVTVSSGVKIIDTQVAQIRPQNLDFCFASSASVNIGYDISTNFITVNANYIDGNSNRSVLTRDYSV
jgi:hypothetical protein